MRSKERQPSFSVWLAPNRSVSNKGFIDPPGLRQSGWLHPVQGIYFQIFFSAEPYNPENRRKELTLIQEEGDEERRQSFYDFEFPTFPP
jgi:hypothetical protein